MRHDIPFSRLNLTITNGSVIQKRKDKGLLIRMETETKKDPDVLPDVDDNDSGSDRPAQLSRNTVEILFCRMQEAKDFPAFSQHILEINQKASTSSANLTSPSQLASIILKDYSLTNKLLRLVNSAIYGNYAGTITTISRAVMILGFEQVCLAASSLMLFDHLRNRNQSEELKDAAVCSFMSGLLARDLAGKMGLQNLEEAFICAMLHNLGRHLVIYYLPDESGAIKSIMDSQEESESNASRSVLGMSYEDIAMAVLTTWNFPAKIVGSLIRLPPGKVKPPVSEENILQSLAGYANELCDVIRNTQGNARKLALKVMSRRFQNVVPLSAQQLSHMLTTAKVQLEKYSDVLDITLLESHFLQQLAMDAESEPEKVAAGGPGEKITTAAGSGPQDKCVTSRTSENHQGVLINGIQEINNALVSDYQLNDMIFMILETIYRGFDFNRAAYCMMEMSRTKMRARYAFGADIEAVTDKFGFNITNSPTDLFNIALSLRKDVIIEDAEATNIISLIPEWYRKTFLAPAFIIYPIIIRGMPFGLFYADKKLKGEVLSSTQLENMKTLRNQTILAIKQKLAD
jgi:eukaryotic-like serine/threonine-protein kinase